MKIISLVAENILKLHAVHIKPSSSTLEINGDNEAGKSSILDCIIMGLKGGKEIPEVPIKKGADKGSIKMDFGDFKLTRSFTKTGSYLKIEANGQEVKSPQKFLDNLVGKISFNPLAFIDDNDPKAQRAVFMTMMGLDEKDNVLALKEKELFDLRAAKAKEVKAAEAELAAIPFDPKVTETEEVTVDDLLTKLQATMENNKAIEDKKLENDQLKASALALRDTTIPALEKELADLMALVESKQVEIQEANLQLNTKRRAHAENKAVFDHAELIDLAPIHAEISSISNKNSAIKANLRHKAVDTKLATLQAAHSQSDIDLENIRSQRKDLLSSVPMPVPGLSASDFELLFEGIPLSQCSAGRKIMVSTAIMIAQHPELRVLIIKDGSLLGKKFLSIVQDMVLAEDYQLWVEKVSDYADYKATGGVGIFIEEGEIVEIDGEKVKHTPDATEKMLDETAAKIAKKEAAKSTEPDTEWD